ncbi:DUF5677 domain-containing protein [Halalkalibacter krulwichiae]|uniref:Uncharacterized protein n=1 Tax=Halalkalibacter krulwichiae TaxID=199441 RepID=A0A1X9M9K2_9BACI|nr:DUF5677 domain-containing protein [Halalkalibacter krulwichiae]ARK30088.1 hypothetical protein BkAM31D_09605 [Halalkalibacter krulwichiae]
MSLNDIEKMLQDLINQSIDEKIKNKEEIDEKRLISIIKKLYSKESVDEYANPIYLSLREKSPMMVEEERLIRQEFESRLQLRWLNAFYDLAAVIKISEESAMEIIDDYLENHAEQKDNKYSIPITFDILMKLFTKAIVVSKEIYTLLKAGFSDGAMSRWRTLHECNVFFRNLTSRYEDENFTNEVISKFADYSIVENYQEINNYLKKDDNFRVNQVEFDSITKDYQELLAKYGRHFSKPYSWAQSIFPHKSKIYFSDLEKNAGIDHLAIYYKLANYHIHASPTGLYNSLGNIEDERIKKYGYVFGPSNYGLSIPGQLTIISLMQISTSLLLLNSNIDRMIRATIFQKFVDDASSEFDRIQKEIEKEELNE